MKLPSPKFNHGAHSVELTIDLNELFDSDIDRALGESIGTDIVERIVDFTESGKNAKGRAFKKYDDDYVESDDFKAAGKSRNKVNMSLYGDMLSQLEVIKFSAGKVTLGWDDATQNAKAYAHMTGFKGHPTIKNGPVREFLIVSQKLLDSVVEEFSSKVTERKDVNTKNDKDVNEALTARSLLRSLDDVESQRSNQSTYNLFFGVDDA